MGLGPSGCMKTQIQRGASLQQKVSLCVVRNLGYEPTLRHFSRNRRGDDNLHGIAFVLQASAGPIVQPDPAG
jgi:hypothetical protein